MRMTVSNSPLCRLSILLAMVSATRGAQQEANPNNNKANHYARNYIAPGDQNFITAQQVERFHSKCRKGRETTGNTSEQKQAHFH
jgi:hypothetical protein